MDVPPPPSVISSVRHRASRRPQRPLREIVPSWTVRAVRLQERLKSPLELREVRLRGLWPQVTGASKGIPPRPREAPPPAPPRSYLAERGEFERAPAAAVPFSLPRATPATAHLVSPPSPATAGEWGRGRGGLADASPIPSPSRDLSATQPPPAVLGEVRAYASGGGVPLAPNRPHHPEFSSPSPHVVCAGRVRGGAPTVRPCRRRPCQRRRGRPGRPCAPPCPCPARPRCRRSRCRFRSRPRSPPPAPASRRAGPG
jgi:hypothetical protein